MNQPTQPSWLVRNWKWLVPTLCLAGLVVVLGFVMLAFYGVSTIMKSSGAYQMALDRARNNPEVVSALGEPIVEGFFTTGSINENDSSGLADLSIPISGPAGDARIYLTARQSAGKWTFSHLLVVTTEPEKRIDLLQEKETLDQ